MQERVPSVTVNQAFKLQGTCRRTFLSLGPSSTRLASNCSMFSNRLASSGSMSERNATQHVNTITPTVTHQQASTRKKTTSPCVGSFEGATVYRLILSMMLSLICDKASVTTLRCSAVPSKSASTRRHCASSTRSMFESEPLCIVL